MVEVIERIEVGVIEVGFHADRPIRALAVADFIAALSRAAADHPGFHAALEVADIHTGSIHWKFVARLGLAVGVAAGTLVSAKGVGVLADVAQVAGFVGQVAAAVAGRKADDPVVAAACRYVEEHGDGARIEIEVPGEQCAIVDRAHARAIAQEEEVRARFGARAHDLVIAHRADMEDDEARIAAIAERAGYDPCIEQVIDVAIYSLGDKVFFRAENGRQTLIRDARAVTKPWGSGQYRLAGRFRIEDDKPVFEAFEGARLRRARG